MPDATPFEDLLQRFLAPLRRLAWAYTHDKPEADELLQEIAVALWTALPRFRGDSSERTWVYRVAHNTALRYVANRKRRGDREPPLLSAFQPAGLASDPEHQAMAQEQTRRLGQAVRELDMPDRQIAVLHLEGMTAIEMESILGMTAGSIATRLTRIRQKLTLRLRGEEVRP